MFAGMTVSASVPAVISMASADRPRQHPAEQRVQTAAASARASPPA
jgi:hypothetical protein